MNSSSIWNAVKKANAGTFQQIDPKIWPGPDPEVFARSFQLQPWTTIRGNASATFPVRSIAQDEGAWIDLSTYADAAFWIEVAGVNNPATGVVSLNLETSPVKDEPYFKPVAPPLTLVPQAVNGSPTPYLVRTVRTPTTAPLAKYTRWRLSVPGGAGGSWDATFRIRGAAGRTAFMVPTQLQGCFGWFRADLGITLSTGNVVATWADQSGKGNIATAPAGREPAYNVAGHQINGQPTLYFDPTGAAGTEKILECTSGMFSTAPAVHAFVVHRRATATETVAKRTGFWHIGGGSGEKMPSEVDGKIYDDFMSNMTYDTGPPAVALNTPHVYEVKADNTGWANFLNGKVQGSNGTNALTPYNPPQIGGNLLFGPNFYYGDMAELIFYSRLLSTSERALLIGYLNGRYGLNAK